MSSLEVIAHIHNGFTGKFGIPRQSGIANTVSRSDHVHPTDTSRAAANHTHEYLPLTGGTISGALALSGYHAMMARHLDGSTDGYTGELYLNYNNPNADIYLGTAGRITDNGASYTGTAYNADKLDGYHANDFVFLQNFMAGKLGSTIAYYSTSVNKDCNSIEDFVSLAGGADGLHYPTANTYYYIFTLKYADTAKKQIAFGYKGNVVDNIVFRTCNDGTWDSWKGINADKLDGYHATDFCQTAFSPNTDMNKVTVSGAYRINQGNTNAPSGTDWGQIFVVHGGGDTIAQLMFDYQKGKCWLRTGNPSDVGGTGAWTEWRSLYTSENITYGTSSLTAGTSTLATGSIYLQYE